MKGVDDSRICLLPVFNLLALKPSFTNLNPKPQTRETLVCNTWALNPLGAKAGSGVLRVQGGLRGIRA